MTKHQIGPCRISSCSLEADLTFYIGHALIEVGNRLLDGCSKYGKLAIVYALYYIDD